MLELLTRRRRLTQTNHAVEQWRAREPAKSCVRLAPAYSVCTASLLSFRSSKSLSARRPTLSRRKRTILCCRESRKARIATPTALAVEVAFGLRSQRV